MNLGLSGLVRRQVASKLAHVSKSNTTFKLSSKHAKYGLICRPGTSDLAVFDQIFTHREYRCLDDHDLHGLILDCGANTGYSSAYFLTRFKKCKVIAVEPHPDNFIVLKQNLEPYKNGYECIQAAVWSHPTQLSFDQRSGGVGHEWGRSYLQLNKEASGDTLAVDIPSLLKVSGFGRIALLKMDIEGAEEQVFGARDTSWLSHTDNIVIELHGNRRRDVFMNAIKGHGFSLSQCDELTVGQRVKAVI